MFLKAPFARQWNLAQWRQYWIVRVHDSTPQATLSLSCLRFVRRCVLDLSIATHPPGVTKNNQNRGWCHTSSSFVGVQSISLAVWIVHEKISMWSTAPHTKCGGQMIHSSHQMWWPNFSSVADIPISRADEMERQKHQAAYIHTKTKWDISKGDVRTIGKYRCQEAWFRSC